MSKDPLEQFRRTVERASREFQQIVASPQVQQLQRVFGEIQQTATSPSVQRLLSDLQQLKGIVAPHLVGIQRTLEILSPRLIRMYQEFDKWNISREVMSQAGWLPHYTTPFEKVAQCRNDPGKVKQLLLDYYENNWTEVRAQIEDRLSEYKLDSEAKEVMIEALDGHEAGQYRSVCRLIYPEIDRLFRVEMFNNAVGQKSSKKLVGSLVDNQRPFGTFTPRGLYDLTMFSYLTKSMGLHGSNISDAFIIGLFESVDATNIKRFEVSEIPNRHAAVHGLISYSSRQNSLNAIFMADYIYQVFSDLKP